MKSIQEIREAHCDLLGSLDLSPFYSQQLSKLGEAINELERLREVNAELVEALTVARAAMEHMGDKLNDMDAVEDDDEPHLGSFDVVEKALSKAGAK